MTLDERIRIVDNKYAPGEKIWSNTYFDELRRKECLCLNCDRKNEEKPYSSCPVAKKIFKICTEYNMAMAITRCGAKDSEGNLLYKPVKE